MLPGKGRRRGRVERGEEGKACGRRERRNGWADDVMNSVRSNESKERRRRGEGGGEGRERRDEEREEEGGGRREMGEGGEGEEAVS